MKVIFNSRVIVLIIKLTISMVSNMVKIGYKSIKQSYLCSTINSNITFNNSISSSIVAFLFISFNSIFLILGHLVSSVLFIFLIPNNAVYIAPLDSESSTF